MPPGEGGHKIYPPDSIDFLSPTHLELNTFYASLPGRIENQG